MSASPDDMDRVIESGDATTSGPGVITASKAKSKDGDQSVAFANAVGDNQGGWMEMLNDGADNPYPGTAAALKAKNTRSNNDSFK